MFFLNPTSDIAFKKLFGNVEHKNVTIDFLNSILERAEGEKIVDVTFGDPNNQPKRIDSKESIFDVKCLDQKGTHYIVEMQVAREHDYTQRCLYYSSVAISGQLQKKDMYEKLAPVIFIGILNFNLLKTSNHVSHHFIVDRETGEHALRGLEFHFVELKKFKIKQEEELVTELDKWIYMLKYASNLNQMPEVLKQSAVMQEAFDILERGSWSAQELEDYEIYWKKQWSARSQLETAKMEGEEIGEERGIEKGATEKARAIARDMLQENMDIQKIARLTGLTENEIKGL